ncbi:hypothetical protein NQ315_011083 [Exocentrus adspersus]|uniref:Regucalcin n=1 Tax=Exocentrus adspersus TaxID=1586481 RepID=A0AAV8VX79_9CUCU|nr:hypothetical protein NQ315_011083 [Exocentrus adspersus]
MDWSCALFCETMDSDSDNEETGMPPEALEADKINSLNLVPEKSKKKYELAYKSFMNWRNENGASSFSENLLLTYFGKLAERYKSSSLWTTYSMLRSMLNIHHNENIEKYSKLRAFLKSKSEGYHAKKAKIFTPSQINAFIDEAPDYTYLATKVALIMGIMGACRSNELYLMKMKDIQDITSGLLVSVPNTKTKIIRKFTVTGKFYEICKKYIAIRSNITAPLFFLNYHNGKCTHQRIGINKFSSMGKQIATYLNLSNPQLYSGHSFRRTSATLLVNEGGDITALKRRGGWRPRTVAEEYIDEPIQNKLDPPNKIVGTDFNLPALHQITDPIDHAECPVWDPRTGLLYFVDIHSGKIFSYDYTTKDIHSIKLNGEVAPVLPSKDPNKLIVGLNMSVTEVEWDGKDGNPSQKILTSIKTDQPGSRMNDGKVDEKGRVWIGSMGEETEDGILTPNSGALFKITKETVELPTPLIAPVNVSNGQAWNRANTKFYYIDSPTREIVEYDFDNEKGEISSRRVVFSLETHHLAGVPDGMTIDKDDNLWIALYGGGSVIKVNPSTGQLLQRIAIPAEAVTSATWGGPNLDILFVTTSRYSLTESQRLKQPAAGSVFAVTNLYTNGLPIFYADIV